MWIAQASHYDDAVPGSKRLHTDAIPLQEAALGRILTAVHSLKLGKPLRLKAVLGLLGLPSMPSVPNYIQRTYQPPLRNAKQ